MTDFVLKEPVKITRKFITHEHVDPPWKYYRQWCFVCTGKMLASDWFAVNDDVWSMVPDRPIFSPKVGSCHLSCLEQIIERPLTESDFTQYGRYHLDIMQRLERCRAKNRTPITGLFADWQRRPTDLAFPIGTQIRHTRAFRG